MYNEFSGIRGISEYILTPEQENEIKVFASYGIIFILLQVHSLRYVNQSIIKKSSTNHARYPSSTVQKPRHLCTDVNNHSSLCLVFYKRPRRINYLPSHNLQKP